MEFARRLGIEPGQAIAVVNEPPDFWSLLRPLPRNVEVLERASRPLDVLVYFSDTLENVERRVPAFASMLKIGGTLWVGHPRDKIATALVDRIGARAHLATAELIDAGGGWMMRRLVKRA
ncbi:MAG TPA: hypothetical protein VHN37_02935 [Actinomycetota bacterium]|nr:hypothetical protein [Actinomycetota bacterium]